MLALLLVVSGVLIALRAISPRMDGAGRPTAAVAPEPGLPVGIATAAIGDARVVLNGIGTVTPLANVTVRTQVSGQLLSVGFAEGQVVHKGDFLAQVDSRPYQVLLQQYQGQLAKDQAILKQVQADLARYQTLLKQDSIARQQAEDQIFLVLQDQAAIISDQAQVDAQKLNIAYCHIVSPVDGRVGLRQVDPGNYVQTSDTNGIVTVEQLQPISVVFPLPEDDLPLVLKRLHAGEPMPVVVYDRSNETELARGTLAAIDNSIDTTTGTWKLRAVFANADEALFPNQFVNARLLAQTLRGVVTVAAASVRRGPSGAFVWLVGADDTVTARPVRTGVTDGDQVQILSGLSAGDSVVTDGTDRLRDGVRVAAREHGPAVVGAWAGEPRQRRADTAAMP
jgi:multidrug efflux system membrane fusion protein